MSSEAIARFKKEITQKLGLTSKEEAIAKGIADLTDEDKLEYFSNLIQGEDEELAIMKTVAERYDIAWMNKLVNTKLKLRTSVGGWRAGQVVGIATEKMKEERKSLLGRILKRDGKGSVEVFE